MTFLAHWFLIAVLAGIIPVVLHMIHRQRAKEQPFPTLRFLRVSVEKTRRRRRVQDLLLLVLRTAALVLVAIGLARPTITGLGALWGGARSAVVIVLDNSASMGMIDGGRPRLDTARAAALEILDELADGDQVALLLAGGPVPAEPAQLQRTQEQARQRLAECRASYTGAELAAKLGEARKLLAEADAANKCIYVITDMQARCWESLGAEGDSPIFAAPSAPQKSGQSPTPGSDIPIVLVDCHRQPKPNVAVGRVRLETPLPIAGLPVKATVELQNTSSIAQQRYVELLINGTRRASSPALALPPDGRIRHEFVFDFRQGGLHRGQLRLVGEDGLALDDRHFFAVAIDRAARVAIIRGRQHEIPYLDDAFYIRQALAPHGATESAIETTVLDAAELADEPLGRYRVVLCVNLPAPDGSTARRLRRYVAEGGTLVWICGDRVEPDAYNRMNVQSDGQLLPGALLGVRAAKDEPERDSWNVTFLDQKYPAFADLTEPASLFESILVYKHVRFDAAAPGTWVLARLDDGQVLLAERKVERGRVLLLGTSCQVDWTNLPLRPIFLPMVLRLTYELAGGPQGPRELLAGAPLVLRWEGIPPGATGVSPVSSEAEHGQDARGTPYVARGVEIQSPSGEKVRLSVSTHQGSEGDSPIFAAPSAPQKSGQSPGTVRYTDTHRPGIYVVRPLGDPTSEELAVAVNIDPDEAEGRTISEEELQHRLGGAPLVFTDHPEDLGDVFRRLREGHGLRDIFLSVVLLVLIFETLLSNRLVPKPSHDREGAAQTAA